MAPTTDAVLLVTDDGFAASQARPPRVLSVERVRGPYGFVSLVWCRDLEAALDFIRRVEARRHRARLHADERSARQFAEALVAGRADWADEEQA